MNAGDKIFLGDKKVLPQHIWDERSFVLLEKVPFANSVENEASVWHTPEYSPPTGQPMNSDYPELERFVFCVMLGKC